MCLLETFLVVLFLVLAFFSTAVVVLIFLVVVIVVFNLNDDVLKDGVMMFAASHGGVIPLRHAHALNQLMTLLLLTALRPVIAHHNTIALLDFAVEVVALPELGIHALYVLRATLGRDHPIIELIVFYVMSR